MPEVGGEESEGINELKGLKSSNFRIARGAEGKWRRRKQGDRRGDRYRSGDRTKVRGATRTESAHPDAGRRDPGRRLFLPDAPGRYPVVIEYLPYRKNDTTWQGYFGHRYLAERGYAAIRIDVRGTGDSEGTALDEYCPQEQLDGVAAIAWLAEQPWSTGAVGMFGTSYGGFNSLQVAMHRPPALKAICPMYFTDNRYTDDCHYKGGAMQMLYDVGTYGLSMVGQNMLPPRPDLVGERWGEIWEEHLRNEPWLLRWLAHPTLDEQWRQGSLCENYGAIELRDLPDRRLARRLHQLQPAHLRRPALSQEADDRPLAARAARTSAGPARASTTCARWRASTTTGCKGIDNGIMDEPPIAIYVQQYDRPDGEPAADQRLLALRGRMAARARTRGDAVPRRGALRCGRPAAATRRRVDCEYHPAVGTTFGMFSAGAPHVLPADQRAEEAYSAVYTGPRPDGAAGDPRPAAPRSCWVDSDAEVITFAARLCDVAPDGSSALVTKGVLNATHRDSHSDRRRSCPASRLELTIELDATSWLFEPGHRLRLSVSNADFPNTWPSPTLATSRLHRGADRPSRLILPVVAPSRPSRCPGPISSRRHFPSMDEPGGTAAVAGDARPDAGPHGSDDRGQRHEPTRRRLRAARSSFDGDGQRRRAQPGPRLDARAPGRPLSLAGTDDRAARAAARSRSTETASTLPCTLRSPSTGCPTSSGGGSPAFRGTWFDARCGGQRRSGRRALR